MQAVSSFKTQLKTVLSTCGLSVTKVGVTEVFIC